MLFLRYSFKPGNFLTFFCNLLTIIFIYILEANMIMKRGIYIYSILGIFTCLLIFYQLNYNLKNSTEKSSKVESIKNINQLSIHLNCNVFLVEGEEQHILVEGPGKTLQQIKTSTKDGCTVITREKAPFLKEVLNIFNWEKNSINIYVTLPNLDHVKLSDIDELKDIKFISNGCLGLIVSNGQKLVIESKFLNSCV